MVYADPVNLTTMAALVEYSNSVTSNWFGILIPICLMLIIFLYLKNRQFYTLDCVMAAGYISTIVATFLRLAGFITTFHLFFFIIITALSTVIAFAKKGDA